MDQEVIFGLFKNIIVAQNKDLLTAVAKKNNIDPQYLIDKYLRSEYYLPIIDSVIQEKLLKKEANG